MRVIDSMPSGMVRIVMRFTFFVVINARLHARTRGTLLRFLRGTDTVYTEVKSSVTWREEFPTVIKIPAFADVCNGGCYVRLLNYSSVIYCLQAVE